MRTYSLFVGIAVLISCGCSSAKQTPVATTSASVTPTATTQAAKPTEKREFVGFDRNEYPGDTTMAAMRNTFAFTGYWLTVPPGAMFNQWKGKREILRQQGWGFLLLANGKFEAEILKAQKTGTKPEDLGRKDAAAAIASAKSEGFPSHAILFLDQEEGGRLTAPQAAYLLSWTEAVAASDFRPGVYASGQRVEDSPGQFITTVEDIRNRVKAGNLHAVEIFVAQDECPPAPGCVLTPKPLDASGTLDTIAWQYSQSPRRPSITKACATTYAPDNRCYAPGFPRIFLDMDTARTPDPSKGR